MNNGYSKYKQASVNTSSRGQVLLMLYEACIKYLKLAIVQIEKKDLAEKGKYILKVQDIVNELSCSLNHEVGGDLSRELERLYNFVIDQITDANIRNDKKPLEVSLQILETLYQGWQGAVAQVAKSGGDAALENIKTTLKDAK